MPLGCPLLDELPHRHLGGDVDYVVELDVGDAVRGPAGSVHGGLVASLVDCAAASLVAREARRMVATSSLSLSYVAAGRVGPLRATAKAVRIGRRQGVAGVTVTDAGNDGRTVATALVTVSLVEGRA
jgi:uncharacterized protein (TIGR00369 family)